MQSTVTYATGMYVCMYVCVCVYVCVCMYVMYSLLSTISSDM